MSCSVDYCTRLTRGRKDKCDRHYRAEQREKRASEPCAVASCTTGRYSARYCARHQHRSTRYGLTDEQMSEIETRRLCDLCHAVPPTVVDHDHRSGLYRGYLCFNCNVLLGHAKDRPFVLLKAIRYLVAHRNACRKVDEL